MKNILRILNSDEKNKLKKSKQPSWIKPMLATLTHETFSNKDWVYERKLDGERCLIFKKGKSLNLMSRNKKKLNNKYPELVKAFKKQSANNFIADGEIVAFKKNVTSFSELQKRMQLENEKEIKNSKVKVYLYLFDMLYYDKYNIEKLLLNSRKKILKNIIDFKDPLRYTTHKNEHGEKYFKEACEKKWEGLIAKKSESNYSHSRSRDWLKFKCSNEQELVIGGYTDPQGKRIGFGALLIGFYEKKKFKYAGKVGTGYNDKLLKSLSKKLSNLQRKSSPFSENKFSTKGVHWVSPKLVAQIGFTEWTNDNKLRHPRFLGLRDDKIPKEVVKEK